MFITLVGMSNIGKSYWSGRLQTDAGFEKISCDFLIEHKLAEEYKNLGFCGLEEVADWMGQPPDERYEENSKKYLNCEKTVMQDIIKELDNRNPDSSIIVDTSGSVIYMEDDMLQELKNKTRIVYLQASKEHYLKLFEQYKFNPKPLIWDNKTNYFELLESRADKYEKLAHIKIPFEIHRNQSVDAPALLNYLKNFIK